MKPTLVYTAVAVLVGFSIAWMMKPSATPEVRQVPSVEQAQEKEEAPAITDSTPPDGKASPRPKLPPTVQPGPAAADKAAEAAKSKDEAKMVRLAEALNLSDEQQEAIVKMIKAAQADTVAAGGGSDPHAILEVAATIGGNIEKSIDSIFTPEQAEAFQALRERNRANQVEATAQKEISDIAGGIDLSPEQRQKALEVVKESVTERFAGRPSGLELVMDTSVLPTGTMGIAPSAVDSMQFFAEAEKDPAGAQAGKIERLRQALDDQVTLYEGILSPGQMAQLRAGLDERKKALDQLSEILK